MKEMPKYWLHYVGRSLYHRDNIYKYEFRHHGVQRAIPFNVLKSLHFGDPILLAWYNRESETATIFGYFIIDGMVNNLPPKIREQLLETLDITDIDSTPRKIERACGSYTIGVIITINETIQSLVEKIQQVCEKNGIDPSKYKWFIHGPFHPLPEPIHLYPINFTRGYMRVDIEDFSLTPTETPHHIYWIYDYKQRSYLPHKARIRLTTRKLDEILEDKR